MSKNVTVQQQHAELVSMLDGKVEGLSKAVLKGMSLQDLQTISDNLNVVNNVPTSTRRQNIADTIVEHFRKNKLTTLKVSEVVNLIRLANLDNYFDKVGSFETPDTVEAVNAFILIGRYKSTSADKDNAERQADWLKRAPAYLKSHLIGKKVKGCLYLNNDSDFYFVKDDDDIKLVAKKNDEAEAV